MVGPDYGTRNRGTSIREPGKCGFNGEVGGLIITRDPVGHHRLCGPLVLAATNRTGWNRVPTPPIRQAPSGDYTASPDRAAIPLLREDESTQDHDIDHWFKLDGRPLENGG